MQPRSWLQPFLLLALEQWQSHGYELIRRMSAFGFEALDRGSVYRTLRQLEKDGLVVSGWDTSKDGPARRLYSLTEAGRVYLEHLRGVAARLPDDAEPVLQPVPVAAAPSPEDEADGVDEAASRERLRPRREAGCEDERRATRVQRTTPRSHGQARTRRPWNAGPRRWRRSWAARTSPPPREAPRPVRPAAAGDAGGLAGRGGEHPDADDRGSGRGGAARDQRGAEGRRAHRPGGGRRDAAHSDRDATRRRRRPPLSPSPPGSPPSRRPSASWRDGPPTRWPSPTRNRRAGRGARLDANVRRQEDVRHREGSRSEGAGSRQAHRPAAAHRPPARRTGPRP